METPSTEKSVDLVVVDFEGAVRAVEHLREPSARVRRAPRGWDGCVPLNGSRFGDRRVVTLERRIVREQIDVDGRVDPYGSVVRGQGKGRLAGTGRRRRSR